VFDMPSDAQHHPAVVDYVGNTHVDAAAFALRQVSHFHLYCTMQMETTAYWLSPARKPDFVGSLLEICECNYRYEL
jgi:hypothetical protein